MVRIVTADGDDLIANVTSESIPYADYQLAPFDRRKQISFKTDQ